jgi:glutaredoxin 3
VTRVVIHTSLFCYWCHRAVRLLEQRGIPFERRDVTGDRAARARLREATGRTSVPQVFIDGRSIGGCQELEALDDSGELDRLLAAPPPPPPAPA